VDRTVGNEHNGHERDHERRFETDERHSGFQDFQIQHELRVSLAASSRRMGKRAMRRVSARVSESWRFRSMAANGTSQRNKGIVRRRSALADRGGSWETRSHCTMSARLICRVISNQRSLVTARPVFHVLERVLGSGGPRNVA
jgi:hypothetical protein